VKITLERLREIIAEEVIKEEVSSEDAQRTIVALLQGTPPNVTGDIMGAVYDEMYDTDVSEPAPESEEDFPTEYQDGGAYGDRPRMGFEESLMEIVREAFEDLELSDMELDSMSDAELIDLAYKDGIEEFIVLDGEGDLANRDEVLAALKDV
jgi:hypothetical protein